MIKSVLFKLYSTAAHTFFIYLAIFEYHVSKNLLLLRTIRRAIFSHLRTNSSYHIILDNTSLVSPNTESYCQSDSVLQSMWMVNLGLPMLGILKINSRFIQCTMQKRFSFVPNEQNRTTVFALFHLMLFNSCGTHLPLFWIFSISRSRLETACWLMPNCWTSCFCVSESSSKNSCNSTSLNFLVILHVTCLPRCLVSKSPLLKRRKHRSHVSCDGACSP